MVENKTENEITLKSLCDLFRSNLKTNWEELLELRKSILEWDFKWTVVIKWKDCDMPEVMANVTLAYRHLEDCIMRLWKVIQADNWGVNIYGNVKTWDVESAAVDVVDGANDWAENFISWEKWEKLKALKQTKTKVSWKAQVM